MLSRHSWAGLRWLVAVGVLLGSFGAISSYGVRAQDGGQGELETASLVPADALLFVSLNTDVSSDQWLIAADLLDQGGLEDIVYETTAQLVAESGLPEEWITPGSSFLGDEISVALLTGGENGVDPVVVLSSANPNQAFETARSRFLAGSDEQVTLPVVEEEGRTVLSSYENDTSLARIDDLIVFGTTSGVQQAVGVAYGAEPALVDQPGFADLVDELEEDRIATAWANGPALTAAQGQLFGNPESVGLGFQEAALLSPAFGLATGGYSAVGVWAEEEGFRLDARVLPGPRDDELTAPDEATELADRAPGDALLFVDGMDLGQIPALRAYLDSLVFGVGATSISEDIDGNDVFVYPTIEESYAELEELIGFDLRADLIDLLEDEYGLWLSSSSLEDAEDLTAVLVSDAADPATVDASIDRLITLLRLDSGDEADFDRIQVGGETVTEILVPDGTSTGPLRVTIGVVDGQLLIGVGAGMEQYLDGPQADSLAGAERFEAAFDALPDDDGGRFYLDINTLIDLQGLPELSGGFQDPAIAGLKGIQALAAVTRMDDETQVTSVVLTIDADVVDEDASTPEASPGADASPVAAGGALSVTSVISLESELGEIIGVSPSDGALLTYDRGEEQVCSVATSGEAEECGPYTGPLDESSVVWSPDGRRAAFTEPAAVRFVDSDVWVFDRDAGELQNWTDDGIVGRLPLFGDRPADLPATIAVDLTPTWTVDGDAVVFARTVIGDDFGSSTTILLRVTGPGQEPERVAPVATFPFATYLGMVYAADGRLLYTSSNVDPADPASGLFELSADGRSVRQVAESSEGLGPPQLLGVTSENQALTSYSSGARGFYGDGQDELCFVALVDLETTERTPLRLPDGRCAYAAGLIEGGSRVVLYTPTLAADNILASLAVVDAARPEAPAVPVTIDAEALVALGDDGDGFWASGHSPDVDLGLTITDDGRMFLREGPEAGVLITLSAA